MIGRGKLLALCVCPPLVVAPLAHHRVRHHVAHALHRVAAAIEPGPVVLPSAAPLCPPGSPLGGGLGPGGGDALGEPAAGGAAGAGGWPYGPFSGGAAYPPGGGGGGGGSPSTPLPPVVTPPVPSTPPVVVPGVAEPETWAQLLAGFAVIGIVARARQSRVRR